MNGILCNGNRVFYAFFGVNGDAHLGTQGLELLYGCRTEGVAGGKEHLGSAFALDVEGQFAAEGGLSRTVQTCHQHHCRLSLDVDVTVFAAHQRGELVMDYLHDHLLRLHCREHVLAKRLLLHVVAELLCYLVAYVGIEQGAAYVLEGFRNVDFGNLAFSLEQFEGSLYLFTEILEHIFL